MSPSRACRSFGLSSTTCRSTTWGMLRHGTRSTSRAILPRAMSSFGSAGTAARSRSRRFSAAAKASKPSWPWSRGALREEREWLECAFQTGPYLYVSRSGWIPAPADVTYMLTKKLCRLGGTDGPVQSTIGSEYQAGLRAARAERWHPDPRGPIVASRRDEDRCPHRSMDEGDRPEH